MTGDEAIISYDTVNDQIQIDKHLELPATTTAGAQFNLADSSGVNPSTPGTGDLWWNGTNLYVKAR